MIKVMYTQAQVVYGKYETVKLCARLVSHKHNPLLLIVTCQLMSSDLNQIALKIINKNMIKPLNWGKQFSM